MGSRTPKTEKTLAPQLQVPGVYCLTIDGIMRRVASALRNEKSSIEPRDWILCSAGGGDSGSCWNV